MYKLLPLLFIISVLAHWLCIEEEKSLRCLLHMDWIVTTLMAGQYRIVRIMQLCLPIFLALTLRRNEK